MPLIEWKIPSVDTFDLEVRQIKASERCRPNPAKNNKCVSRSVKRNRKG